jgi:hypothetical protein
VHLAEGAPAAGALRRFQASAGRVGLLVAVILAVAFAVYVLA